MRLRLVNVGLIRDATLNVADLSIVMGSNNSGKSTAATAVYAAVKASIEFGTGRRSGVRRFTTRPRRQRAAIASEFRLRLREAHSAAEPGTNISSILAPLSADHATRLLQSFGELFVLELERGLGVPLADAATRSTSGRRLPLRIKLESDDPQWSVDIRLRGSKHTISASLSGPVRVDLEDLPLRLESIIERELDDEDAYYVSSVYSDHLADGLFQDWPTGAHYLPAARAGLLQSHRLVAAAMVQRSPLVGIGEVSMPSLSGVVADFVSEILLTNARPDADLRKLAQKIEREVLRGTVSQIEADAGYPDIDFSDESGRYPVHRTSSMVSELAPIVLLLGRSVRKGDLLIIEEPESHLHPAAQVKLAEILYQASEHLFVFITTHSDFFLTEINNRLRERELGERAAAWSSQVVAYWMDRAADGSHLRELKVDPVDGIPEDSFVEVSSALYDEQVRQQVSLIGVAAE